MDAVSQISSGILVSVEISLNLDISIIDQSRFFYNYHILMVNKNNYPVRLLRRHWNIFDSLHGLRTVDGDGVVGLTPLIDSNDKFSYSSGCDMYSEIGYMSGHYVFQRIDTSEEFVVEIPKFDLIFFGKLN